MKRLMIMAVVAAGVACGIVVSMPDPKTRAIPLRVVLIPADGGTEDGTLADYRPVFTAIERETGLAFELRVAQSYSAVVESMCNGTADIAFVGPVTFLQAQDRGCAELLAVAVTSGRSIYYSAFFARRGGGLTKLADIRGKRAAFGDVNSTTSFVYPVAMLVEAGIDPVEDLRAVRLTGSHANSLSALLGNQVDVAALSFESYNKALRENLTGVRDVIVVARSEPIPNAPLIMNAQLADATKARLKTAFETIATRPGVTADMVRGYGGAKVDGYDTRFPATRFSTAAAKMAVVDRQLTGALVARAAEN